MISPSAALAGKRCLLGVTGSISCYKAIEVASHLAQLGVEVRTVLTESATRFVQPLAFQAVTGRPAYGPDALWSQDAHIVHARLGRDADLLAVVPATAHTLAKLAAGQADNLLLITSLAHAGPLLVAPAMDGGMWDNAATQANVEILRERGATFVGPAQGHLASGQSGVGRLAEPGQVVGAIRALLGQRGSLAHRHVVVTAGGTREPVDAVRHIANRSSGRQGAALAQAARDQGAHVTLITTAPMGPETATVVRRVATAQEMQEAVTTACQEADVLVMAAAVADFRPQEVSAHKIKKSAGAPRIQLIPNPDILHTIGLQRRQGKGPRVVAGFAAETQDWQENGRAKLRSKNLDLMVVNDVSRADIGFGSEFNAALLLHRDGQVEEVPRMTKFALAEMVMARVAALLT